MMGKQGDQQDPLFIPGINLEKRVRKDHPLRRIKEKIDFDFIYDLVKDKYGSKGNVSIPPPVILKIMFLLFFYDVRSERELMATIPERLDWLWFLGYGLGDEIPHHSVLSKARAKWGPDAFRTFFINVLQQCLEAGLVDGKKIFCDASLIDADASNNSVLDTEKLKTQLKTGFKRIEQRLDDIKADKQTPADSRFISSTDPEASVTRSGGKSKLRYKTHRAVDSKNEVITATAVTPGRVDDGHMLPTLIEEHENTTREKLETVVCDSRYGIKDNFLLCHDRHIKAHMPSLEKRQRGSGRKQGIFPL